MAQNSSSSCDLLLRNGHVVDPENGVDRIVNVAIAQGSVCYVGEEEPSADRVIDATGKIVAPGFVDIHSHAQTIPGHRLQAFDGVTSSFELESGASPVSTIARWAQREGRPLNYGFAAGWLHSRITVLEELTDEELAELPKLPLDSLGAVSDRQRWTQPAGPEQVAKIVELLEEQLQHGAVGIGMLLGYAPRVSAEEVREVARLGARYSAPLFVHTRYGSMVPGHPPLEGLAELIGVARDTGAHLHLCHFNSSNAGYTAEAAEIILKAQADGVSFSTENYPYGFASTVIGAAFLAPETLEAAGKPPSIITPLSTGEPAESYAQLHQLRAEDPGQLCLIRYYEDPWDGDDLRQAMALPGACFGSDAMPLKPIPGRQTPDLMQWPLSEDLATHPRSTACFTRALAWLYRDTSTLSLQEVIARSTTMPAEILRPGCPALEKKGHLGVGADADVVVFDISALEPNTSVAPTGPSRGMEHVLVCGQPVIKNGELIQDSLPGHHILGSART